jgi:hypothetical protein
MRRILLSLSMLVALNLGSLSLKAQDAVEAPVTAPKSATGKKPLFEPDSKRAGMLSALVPGLGQIYNRQYWKAGIIYAGLGVASYYIITNNNEYNRYRKAYVSRLSNNPANKDEFDGILTTDGIKQYQDEYKKYLDLTVLLTAIGYAGQIMEAIAGAHLKNFDVSQNISFNVSPVLTPNRTVGIGLVMHF